MISDYRLRELIIDTETQYKCVDRTLGATMFPEHLAEVKSRFFDIIEALKELKELRERAAPQVSPVSPVVPDEIEAKLTKILDETHGVFSGSCDHSKQAADYAIERVRAMLKGEK